jgi:hypothetical protein
MEWLTRLRIEKLGVGDVDIASCTMGRKVRMYVQITAEFSIHIIGVGLSLEGRWSVFNNALSLGRLYLFEVR